MGKYGETALRAVGLLQRGADSAESAWRTAAAEMFPNAPEARRKGCPRATFLGLCEAGMVRGVSPVGAATSRQSVNATYAVSAVRQLAAEPDLARGSKLGLWRRVMEDVGGERTKRPNEQMDVVLALWEKRLITT